MSKLLLIIFSLPFLAAAQTSVTAKIDSICAGWKPGAPGGVVAVVQQGNVIYKKAFGLANVATKEPNAFDKKYNLASMTKQFTATCIALLEEQGKISAEDDLRKFYPGMKINATIKIKNLIDHTSGLRDASVLAILSGKMNLKGEVRKKYATKKYYLECFLRETDLNFEPGSEHAYTNFNYILLGDIVEHVSGKTLSQFADSAIFKPLGMTNTVFYDSEQLNVHNLATGYLVKGNKYKPRKNRAGIVGDDNLLSTLDDMIKWELNFFHNKLGKGNQELINKMTTSSKLNNGELTKYGYGLLVGDYHGVPMVSHGGDDGRFTSAAGIFPEEELIVIVLTNTSRFNDMMDKGNAIAETFIKSKMKTPQTPKDDYTYIRLSAAELKSREGIYTRIDERGLGRLTRITFDDPDLYSSWYYYWKGVKANPVSKDFYVAVNGIGEPLLMRFDGDSAITITYRDKDFRVRKVKPTHVPYSAYKGSYKNASTKATIKVRSKKNKLIARKGIIRIPLIPFGKDLFYGPSNDVLFIFQRDASGKITQIKANAPDFRNFVFTKQ